MNESLELAYITGIAIGDGNLSNPNGRAVRLRISCDVQYPKIIENISAALSKIFPKNKISKINRGKNTIDISVYNKNLNKLFGWDYQLGPKYKQKNDYSNLD